MSSDKTWAIRVLCLFLVGGGLALVAYFYFISAPPERASTPPTAPSQDLSGDIGVGSLNGESGEAESAPEPEPRGSGVQEAPPDPAPDGVVGSAEEVNAGEAPPDAGLEQLAEPVSPPPEEGDSPEPSQPAEYAAPEEAQAPAAPPPAPEKVPEDKTLYLTIPKMERVQGAEVRDAAGDDAAALDAGAIHLSGTGFPWQSEANVYLAGHRLGYAGTGSYLIFYDLDVLVPGDEILVEDSNGTSYSYRVTGSEEVAPDNLEVAQPAPGKNILTLQTCTLPDYKRRIIVRAERVA